MSSAPPPGNSSANSSSSSPPTDNKSPPAPPPSSSPPPPSPPPSNSDDDSASPPASSKSDGGGDDPPSPPPPSKSKSDDDDSGHKSSPSSQKPLPPPSPPTHESSSGHKELSPPDSDRDSSSNSNRHSDINLPIMIGVVAGVGLFAVIMVTACIFCSRKKKKPHDQMIYYDDSGGFYGGGPPQHWNNGPQGMNPAVKLPPSQVPLQGGGGGGGGGGGWQPPSTLMSGSDGSSIYSGPRVPPLPPPSPAIALGFNKSTFSYEELAAATSGFAPANLLGQGGFGYVHKGVLPNGKEIAVKQLKSGSGQGEREFQAEVEIISRVHHRHLVSLVGYCISGVQRMLVYEYVPNKTLEFHLYGKGLPVMDWLTRLRIALGSAKGLAYLHEDCHPRIIHRDIKAANILLDYRFEAMVADFGLAKLSTDSHTHVSTRVMGTFGYLAPEYASSGKLTEKSDVFSFGVMLLELITGRRPVGSQYAMEDSLVDWARPILSECLSSRNFQELVDPRLEGNYNPEEMSRMVACAAASVRHSAKRRPRMSQIVRALEGDVSLEDLNEGARGGNGSYFGSGSDYDSSPYHNTPKRGRRVVVASPDYSSDYGGTGGSGGFSGESQRGVGNQRQNSPPYGYDEPV